jgi:hypothetical protein
MLIPPHIISRSNRRLTFLPFLLDDSPPLPPHNPQTRTPTQAPTRSCFPGEYRPTPTSPCAFCAPGTYWNQTIETTACLDCPAGQTSLQGAVQCYEPCPANTALNTTDLTCVPIPASLTDALAAANLTIDFDTTDVFLVEEPLKLEGTLGAAVASNQTVIVTLSPDTVYPQTQSYVFTSNVIILGQTISGGGRRRQLQSTVRGECVCVCVCVKMYVCVSVCVYMCVCIYVCVCLSVCGVCVCVFSHVSVHVRVCVCACRDRQLSFLFD